MLPWVVPLDAYLLTFILLPKPVFPSLFRGCDLSEKARGPVLLNSYPHPPGKEQSLRSKQAACYTWGPQAEGVKPHGQGLWQSGAGPLFLAPSYK